jgi:hypothetical protein
MAKIEADIINFSICLSDLDKSKLKKADNGKIYLNGVINARKEPDQYGNNLTLSFSKTKEEREAKVDTVYINGNAKSIIFEGGGSQPTFTNEAPGENDDLPW